MLAQTRCYERQAAAVLRGRLFGCTVGRLYINHIRVTIILRIVCAALWFVQSYFSSLEALQKNMGKKFAQTLVLLLNFITMVHLGSVKILVDLIILRGQLGFCGNVSGMTQGPIMLFQSVEKVLLWV